MPPHYTNSSILNQQNIKWNELIQNKNIQSPKQIFRPKLNKPKNKLQISLIKISSN